MILVLRVGMMQQDIFSALQAGLFIKKKQTKKNKTRAHIFRCPYWTFLIASGDSKVAHVDCDYEECPCVFFPFICCEMNCF